MCSLVLCSASWKQVVALGGIALSAMALSAIALGGTALTGMALSGMELTHVACSDCFQGIVWHAIVQSTFKLFSAKTKDHLNTLQVLRCGSTASSRILA